MTNHKLTSNSHIAVPVYVFSSTTSSVQLLQMMHWNQFLHESHVVETPLPESCTTAWAEQLGAHATTATTCCPWCKHFAMEQNLVFFFFVASKTAICLSFSLGSTFAKCKKVFCHAKNAIFPLQTFQVQAELESSFCCFGLRALLSGQTLTCSGRITLEQIHVQKFDARF